MPAKMTRTITTTTTITTKRSNAGKEASLLLSLLALLVTFASEAGVFSSAAYAQSAAFISSATTDRSSQDFVRLLEALSGRKPPAATLKLLQGTTAIVKTGNGFELRRADGSVLKLGSNNSTGVKWSECWSKAEKAARESCGDSGEEFIKSIRAISKQGDRIVIQRSGNDVQLIDLTKLAPNSPVKVGSVRLSHISLRLDTSGPHPAIRDIQGIGGNFSWAGICFSLDLKEFCRWVDEAGRKQVYFAVGNPLPQPMRDFLHISPVIPVQFAVH